MSHFVSAEEPRTRSTGARSRPFARCANACPAFRASLVEFLRHLPGDAAAFRPRAAGLRALWRQSDAPADNPMKPVVGSKGASCRCAGSRPVTPSATTPAGPPPTARAWRPSRSATRTAIRARRARAATAAKPCSPAWRWSAGVPCPVRRHVSMDLIVVDVTDVPEGAVAAGRPRHAHRRRSHRSTKSAAAPAPSATKS